MNSISFVLLVFQRFPQQRFSPVMKPVTSADIPYRPKPIKAKLESPLKGHLERSQRLLADQSIPRPASTGSTFQPKGAVFKAHSPKGRQGMTLPRQGSLDLKDLKQRAADAGSAPSTPLGGHAGQVFQIQRSTPGSLSGGMQVISSTTTSAGQQMVLKNNQVKTIHNITMVTQDKHGVILSSNSQTTLGRQNGKGPIVGKISQKGPRGALKQTLRPHTVTFALTQPQPTHQVMASPLVATSGQGLPSVQPVLTSDGQPRATTTVTSAYKPLATPIPIASKYVVPQQNQAAASQSSSAAKPTVTGVTLQPQSLIGTTQANNANLKNLSAILVPSGIPTSQYAGMTILNPTNIAAAAAAQNTKAVAVSSGLPANVNMGYITTTLRNMAPPANNSAPNTPQAQTPTQNVAPAMLTNFVLKTNQGQLGQAVQNVQQVQQVQAAPAQNIAQTLNLNQQNISRATATQLQYILPSLTVQTTPGGKVQNVLQMALPGTQVQHGNIQLAIPGSPSIQTANQQQKLHLTAAANGTLKQNVASLTQNVASQTLQVLNQNVTGGGHKQQQPQTVPVITSQIVTINQPSVSMATGQTIQLATTPGSVGTPTTGQPHRLLLPSTPK